MSMLNKFAVFVVGAVIAVYSQCGFAVGFGRSSHTTTLGQSLEMVIPITADSTEQLTNDCLSAEVLVGDTKLYPSAVRSRLDWLGGSGVRVLRVSTSARIDEPVVTVTVAAGCPPRLTRQFVLFIDPPAADVDTAAAVPLVSFEIASVAPTGPTAALSPVAEASVSAPSATADAESAAARRTQVQSAERPRGKRTRPAAPSAAAASGGDAVVLVGKPSGAKQARAVKHASRLQLEPDARPVPAVPDAASVPELMASAASAAEAAASEAEASAQRQREALASLQKQMEAIKAQAETANKSIAQMQSSLRESQESSNWWLLVASALAAAVVALSAWVGWLLRQGAAATKAGAWWSAESQRAALDEGRDRTSKIDSKPGPLRTSFQDSSQWGSAVVLSDTAVGVLTDFQSSRDFAVEPQTRGGTGSITNSQGLPPEQDCSPFLTADELIDLGQQAEFFVALGQDDSAIGLLERQLPRAGGGGPWPYLKLLEIHRRQEDRSAFDRVRDRFEARFGVSPADWRSPSIAGKSLDAYGDTVKRIESAWADPEEAMQLLETLMVRGDADSGVFDLAAIGDLESLYLLAKSLRVPAQVEAESVDFFLPLELEPGPPVGVPARQPAQAEDSRIDFNLDLAPPDDDHGALK
jgi:hypothetical protein